MPDYGRRRIAKPLWQTAAEAMGAEGEMLARIPVVVIRGMREAEICGCCGILEYGDARVTLALEGSVCTVTGEGLTLEDFRDGTLFVRGVIGRIVFGEEGA